MTSDNISRLNTSESEALMKIGRKDKQILPGVDNKQICTDNSQCYVGTWDQAQTYLRDNEYIKKGYRINFMTAKRIMRSLFMCHNESTNVWSHLCGALFFFLLILYIAICINPGDVVGRYSWNVKVADNDSANKNTK